MVVASFALLVALGGTSVAAVVNVPNNSVGTAKIKNNAVTSAKIAGNAVNSSKIANGTIQAGDLSAGAKTSGPAGPQGPPGPPGPAGAAATALWAVVDQNGTLVRNKGAASAQKNNTGQYQVIFNQDVTGCSYQVTPGGPTTGTSFVEISAGQLPAVAAGVRIFVLNANATAFVDSAFYVAVFC